MREQLSSERVDGGVRRRARSTLVRDSETEIRVEPSSEVGAIRLIERELTGYGSTQAVMVLSPPEARIIAFELLAAADRLSPIPADQAAGPIPAGHVALAEMATASMRDAAAVQRKGR